jgi:hypothetical protein
VNVVSYVIQIQSSLTWLYFPMMQISTYFADKLLKIVSDILHHFKGKSKFESDEPSRESDMHTHKGDAALEFIKHICAVLALDQNVQHDILVNILFEPYL